VAGQRFTAIVFFGRRLVNSRPESIILFAQPRETGGKIMPDYIIAYHGGNRPESPEDGAKQMAKWKAWVAGLGDAVVNPGTPLGKSRIVSSGRVSDDGGSNPMTGFSVVRADSMDAALEIAKGCPYLDIGGTIEVAEVMQMK
jgi:hypothetical protein